MSAPFAGDSPDSSIDADGVTELPADLRRVVDALAAGSALLVTGQGTGMVQRFLLEEDKVTAGRHPRSDISLDHATMSRSHVEFIRQADRFVVRDAGSLNGVYLNGLRGSPRRSCPPGTWSRSAATGVLREIWREPAFTTC